jgi:hypothetical protein
MAKATKVQTCDDGCDEEHDKESESDNDDEPTKDELLDMLEDAKEHFDIKRGKCKDLHKKLEKAHSSLLDEQNVKEHVKTCDVGLTCDIIDDSFYKPIIVAPTNLLVALPPLAYLAVMISLMMPH